ncbi:DUF4123 domain-containing protein [Stenotrophomonas sp. SI-NJAU-1]|jgi:hypothetical protein|uniref:DUF4123 domain-containing protein n=1 Tax=Stenotrophomonas TaxID=40323 RepID=UPI000E3C3AD0|nr:MULTISPECIES: DUF4123 domain-containing protein [Stenotrophomonas]MBO1748394.1 DUF4123 domain-containing protein [Stenotrophomonas indicatrix]UEX16990.1 DUF4123 domain-containing protein [Stenotrophomonas sp. SI-NJAU-1]
MNRYAIVDAAAYADTYKALAWYAQDLPHRSLFARQPEAAHASIGPWLLQLPAQAHTQVDGWLRALELDRPVVAWLTSEAGFEAVFQHLEACLDLCRPNGRLALLRYWDGRVFLRLQRAFTLQQRRQLMGPLAWWRFQILGQAYALDRAELYATEAG